eukprot:2996974-Rhodomonas_salina.4
MGLTSSALLLQTVTGGGRKEVVACFSNGILPCLGFGVCCEVSGAEGGCSALGGEKPCEGSGLGLSQKRSDVFAMRCPVLRCPVLSLGPMHSYLTTESWSYAFAMRCRGGEGEKREGEGQTGGQKGSPKRTPRSETSGTIPRIVLCVRYAMPGTDLACAPSAGRQGSQGLPVISRKTSQVPHCTRAMRCPVLGYRKRGVSAYARAMQYGWHLLELTCASHYHGVSAYARATRSPVLTSRTLLPGEHTQHNQQSQEVYRPTCVLAERLPSIHKGEPDDEFHVRPRYLPTHLLCNVLQYRTTCCLLTKFGTDTAYTAMLSVNATAMRSPVLTWCMALPGRGGPSTARLNSEPNVVR